MMKLKYKYAVSFLFLALNLSCGLRGLNAAEAVYLIPKGYTGPVVIFFDQPDGVTPEVENGFTVYKIPGDGFLKVKTKAIYKINEQIFYYVDETGERTEIEYLYPRGWEETGSGKTRKSFNNINPDDTGIYVMGSEMGSFNGKNGVVRFRSFMIGKAFGSDKLYQETMNKITNLHKSGNF